MDNVDNPPFDIKAFYTSFYHAIAVSPSNALYCQRLYGKNLCQQGFAEVAHIEHLARVAGLAPGVHALDLGCGSGLIAAYLAAFDKTSTRPENTDLARTASALGLTWQAWDYTQADQDHAQRKRQIAEELKDAFAAEGNAFLVEGYLGGAGGVMQAC